MTTAQTTPATSRRLAIVDLIAFITLAVGIALSTGIVLGGVVLLLSGGDSSLISDATTLRLETPPRF